MSNGKKYDPIGRHVLAEIFTTDCSLFNRREFLERAICEAAICHGASVLDSSSRAFEPNGVSVLVLLAESHVSLHTYPEDGVAFFDAFTCGSEILPTLILAEFNSICGLHDCNHVLVERNAAMKRGIEVEDRSCA